MAWSSTIMKNMGGHPPLLKYSPFDAHHTKIILLIKTLLKKTLREKNVAKENEYNIL